MRLMRKDSRSFNLYEPVIQRDADGDKVNTYPEVSAVFCGSIQPYSQERNDKEYGIDPRYAYTVYTPSDAGFKELDRMGVDSPQYEIKVIQRWSDYTRLLVEEVRS